MRNEGRHEHQAARRIKVVEFGQNLAGPYCGQILAFLGAEVVKIERPEGDDARKWGPPFIEGDGTGFIALNRGKKSITCDLADTAQRAALIERIGAADIFVHNLRADVPAKFGIDGPTLTKKFPRLIYADLGAFGHQGPWKDRPGYEPIIQAVAGLISLNGDPSGPEARVGVSIIDLSTGMWTAIGVLAALARRTATGQGSLVNTSLFEIGADVGLESRRAVFGDRHDAAAPGHRPSTLTPYQAFECSDGPLMICPGNDRLWRKFAEVLGHPEWPDEARFKTNVQRAGQRELLLGMIADIMAKESRAFWSAKLDAAGVPNGPLNSVPQVLELAQVAALGMFAQPYAGSTALFHGLPLSLDGERAGGDEKAPKIGEHNGKV